MARRAGVSKTTVSRVLNRRPLDIAVKDETRARIETAAAELGYRPSLFARGLKTKRSNLVGVIVRDLTNPFWSGMVEGISRACGVRGYHVTLTHSLSQADEVREGVMLARLGSDGILLLGDPHNDEQALAEVVAEARAVVAVARSAGELGVPAVRVDNAGAMESVMAFLTELGHRQIAFLGGGSDDAVERHEGFLAACARRGIPVVPEYVYSLRRHGPVSMKAGVYFARLAVRHALRLPNPPTAILATSDGLALGALSGVQSLGLAVPRDVSVVGFDGIPFARFVTPAMTTVEQPVRQMGEVATNLLIDIIEGHVQQRPGAVIRLPARLVRRDSCGVAPTRAASASASSLA